MVHTFQSIAHYQKALIAGQFTTYSVSPGWVCGAFGVSRQYLEYQVKSGKLDVVKIKTSGERESIVLYDRDEVKQFLQRSKKVA